MDSHLLVGALTPSTLVALLTFQTNAATQFTGKFLVPTAQQYASAED
jgi:hypothetical protein